MKSGASIPSSPRQIEDAAAAWFARRDAGLTHIEAAELAAWLASDVRHRAALAQHEQTWRTFDRSITSGAAGAVLEAADATRRRRARRRLAGLTAAVLIVGAGVSWQRRSPEPVALTAVGAMASPTAVVSLPEKKILPDGSVAELPPGAEIVMEYSAGERRVVLRRGTAHFDVARNPARPFVVAAGPVAVRAVGTAFAVVLGRDDVGVIVTEGRVTLETAAREPAFVDAGQRAQVDLAPGAPAAAVVPLAAEELREHLAWRSARVEFSGTPLDEAIALLNRHNRVQFALGDPALARVRVSGFFRADNTAAFVRLLEATFGVRAEFLDHDRIVLWRAR